ncbi:hypothetical protein Lgee_2024 [Legionella geestiana]|uniref:Uncharacterized protein n=1 Tax=Legionella geestiana TaxID=45065 RepID=A0A0W0TP42_9GAMM|nr:bacteriophage holin [Legionella geestiana]KTC97363.1 hypothetical protein Lgee_2024 [Legionella geestiana]QBS12487.1 hypothetical protein E4T54_06835 [Legionella geestiana]QDQ39798.1 hypothetical protein E3226_005025 [Legionella geestiana]STX55069.1 Uncharacterised protein [Legionella geestiana]
MTNHRINALALGLACGVLWGVSVLLMGLMATHGVYGKEFVDSIGTLYIGYTSSIGGSLLGGLIGFIDAFLGGLILGWLYNKFDACCCKKSGTCCPVKAEDKPEA